jgi:Protein of unknown function (DUF2793)
MANTTNLQMPRIEAAQSQKHVTHNEALDTLDAVVQLMVLDRDLATPPGSPVDGARYIVAATPTGAWTGSTAKVAAWIDGAWKILTPREGWQAWVADEDVLLIYNGTSWVPFATGANLVSVPNLTDGTITKLGVNSASADNTNRLVVRSTAALFTTIADSCRLNINKQAATDDAAFVLQTNFSARALIGLLASDDIVFKASPDGTNYWTGLRSHRNLHGRTVAKQAMRRQEASWFPRVGATTLDQLGLGATVTGTATAATPSSSNLFTQASRVRFASAASAGASAGVNGSALPLWRGNASSLGGFYLEMRFGIEVFQTGSRGFAGLYASSSAITNINPSSLVDTVGVGWDASETTMRIMSNSSVSTATRTDLGANFPVNSGQTMFELILSAEPNASEIRYRVENLNSGAIAEGTLTSDLPTTTAFMTPHLWYNNGATAASVEIALAGMYCENVSMLGGRGVIG